MTYLNVVSFTGKIAQLLFGSAENQIANLLETCLLALIIAVLLCFVVSEITRNLHFINLKRGMEKLLQNMPCHCNMDFCMKDCGLIPGIPILLPNR